MNDSQQNWYRKNAGRESTMLTVHVQPGAKRTEIVGLYGDALKVRVAGPAVDGRANALLVQFIAERFGVPASAVTLRQGASSRRKLLEVRGSSRHPEALLQNAK